MQNTTLNIYLLFITITIIIAIYYIHRNTDSTKPTKNTKLANSIEGFETPEPNDITIPEISDTSIKNIVSTSLKELQSGLERFSYLDAPISINDNGQTCMPWDNYNNGKYKANENHCIVPDNTSNKRKCLSATGLLSSCNNFYSDGYIEKMNTINITPIIDKAKAQILFNLGNTNIDLASKNEEIDKLITTLITQRNLENQQLYFIKYNTDNIEDKQKNIDKINKEVIDKQTELNLNQVAFSQFLENNTVNEQRSTLYYKITIGLIITITILGILNLLFSNIL